MGDLKMKKKILIVDDEPDMLFIFEQILLRAGYEVIKARGGQEAINLARSQTPDLILLDIKMPGMDGVETTDYLKDHKSTREIPIVYLSSLVHQDQVEHGHVLGSKIGNLYFLSKTPALKKSWKSFQRTSLQSLDYERPRGRSFLYGYKFKASRSSG